MAAVAVAVAAAVADAAPLSVGRDPAHPSHNHPSPAIRTGASLQSRSHPRAPTPESGPRPVELASLWKATSCFTDDLLSMMPDESGAGVTGTEGRGTPAGYTPASPPSSLLQGEIHDRATYGPDMAVEDLVTPEVPSPAKDTTRGKRGPSGPETPPRMLRARRAMDGGVSTMGPADAEAQHAGAGSGPTRQG